MLLICHCLLVTHLLVASGQGPQTPAQPGDLIAALHQFERAHGRDEWSWRQLQAARAEITDPRFRIPPLLPWLNETYLFVLRWFWLLWILLMFLGLFQSFRLWRQQALIRSLVWTTLWLLGAVLMYLIIVPASSAVVVIKKNETMLRTGNGLSYPPVLDSGIPIKLASGVEAQFLARRNNHWIHIQLPGNLSGWVPLESIMLQ